MPFQPGWQGGPGRPKKIVEDAQHSVLLEVFDEKAERAVVLAMVRTAKKGDVSAATWLWDRKYGKVKESREHSGGFTIRIERADPDASSVAPSAESD